ncbi:MAG: DUF3107 domain-containing protein [Acidimicrobiia bacterium]|nr:DUF3107 domain-containing protein [Acidimicrobiia bacterium]
MEVKIGVVHTIRELTLEFDGSAAEVSAAVEAAMSGADPVLWLSDAKGRRVGVPTDKVAYVEIGSDEALRQVGFGRA